MKSIESPKFLTISMHQSHYLHIDDLSLLQRVIFFSIWVTTKALGKVDIAHWFPSHHPISSMLHIMSFNTSAESMDGIYCPFFLCSHRQWHKSNRSSRYMFVLTSLFCRKGGCTPVSTSFCYPPKCKFWF